MSVAASQSCSCLQSCHELFRGVAAALSVEMKDFSSEGAVSDCLRCCFAIRSKRQFLCHQLLQTSAIVLARLCSDCMWYPNLTLAGIRMLASAGAASFPPPRFSNP